MTSWDFFATPAEVREAILALKSDGAEVYSLDSQRHGDGWLWSFVPHTGDLEMNAWTNLYIGKPEVPYEGRGKFDDYNVFQLICPTYDGNVLVRGTVMLGKHPLPLAKASCDKFIKTIKSREASGFLTNPNSAESRFPFEIPVTEGVTKLDPAPELKTHDTAAWGLKFIAG